MSYVQLISLTSTNIKLWYNPDEEYINIELPGLYASDVIDDKIHFVSGGVRLYFTENTCCATSVKYSLYDGNRKEDKSSEEFNSSIYCDLKRVFEEAEFIRQFRGYHIKKVSDESVVLHQIMAFILEQ